MTDDTRPVAGMNLLARERTPQRDLWPGIEGRISRRRHGAWPAALAASLVAGIALAVLLDLPESDPRSGGAVPVAFDPGTRLAAPTRAIVKANLDILRDAERQLERALSREPDAEGLRRMLASNRRQQADLRQLIGHTA